jgi:hypothetical protein
MGRVRRLTTRHLQLSPALPPPPSTPVIITNTSPLPFCTAAADRTAGGETEP